MKLMLVAATVLSVVPLALSVFMPDWYLGDKQNAVDATDLKGERAGVNVNVTPEEKEKEKSSSSSA